MQTPSYDGAWEDVVAYCGPGETVTSFYAMVGEREHYRTNDSRMLIIFIY